MRQKKFNSLGISHCSSKMKSRLVIVNRDTWVGSTFQQMLKALVSMLMPLGLDHSLQSGGGE